MLSDGVLLCLMTISDFCPSYLEVQMVSCLSFLGKCQFCTISTIMCKLCCCQLVEWLYNCVSDYIKTFYEQPLTYYFGVANGVNVILCTLICKFIFSPMYASDSDMHVWLVFCVHCCLALHFYFLMFSETCIYY